MQSELNSSMDYFSFRDIYTEHWSTMEKPDRISIAPYHAKLQRNLCEFYMSYFDLDNR